MERRPSVAIIGSGLAGLTAAYLLSSSGTRTGLTFDVHLFEKAPVLGMDSNSISVPADGSREHRIDVPMRSFQGGYYKQLIALYRRLGVEFCHADFTYSFSSLTYGTENTPELQTYLIYNGRSGARGVNLPANDPTRQMTWHFSTRAMSFLCFVLATIILLYNYLRLLVLASPFFRPQPSLTYQQWVTQTTPKGIWARWLRLDVSWCNFTDQVLLPMFSAVCTAPKEDIYLHPMAEFLDYIWLTFGSHHYVVQHGVRDVVSRLVRNIPHIHLSTSIVSIDTDPNDPTKLSITTTDRTYTGFSHLVIATQANSGLSLLASYQSSIPKEATEHREAIEGLIQCLTLFRYRKTVVINHTDEKILPSDPRDKRDLNLVQGTAPNPSEKKINPMLLPMSYTMATHVVSHSKNTPIYQTTNPIMAPRPDTILSVAVLERAVLTTQSKAALSQLSIRDDGQWPLSGPSTSLGRLQGAGRFTSPMRPGIWICGSYAHGGIPLLEGCVASARDIVEKGILRCEGVTIHDTPW